MKKNPFIEFGEDSIAGFKAFFALLLFLATFLGIIACVIGVFATCMMDSNWPLVIDLSILAFIILFINIKRIGNWDNFIYHMWRIPLNGDSNDMHDNF